MSLKRNRTVELYSIALVLLLISNICFYTAETPQLYRLMSGTGILLSFVVSLRRFSMVIKKYNCILWLTAVYGMFMFYGHFFLREGTFPWTSMITRYLENIAFYVAIKGVFREDYRKLAPSFILAGVFSLLYLIAREGVLIALGGYRIGGSLSGNVNTAGYCFGIVSLVVIWSYCMKRDRKKLILFLVLLVFMILTGSKKVTIVIMADLFLILVYRKGKITTWILLAIGLTAGVYCLFNVPYLYEIMGVRIESMFLTLLYGNDASLYSYSTEMRGEMVQEAFRLFLHHPIFGGGYNYFASMTVTRYDYCHCNYAELLCSFGVVGTMLYYSKHLSVLGRLTRALKRRTGNRDLAVFGVILLLMILTLDWGAVTFSGQATWYLPVLISNAACDTIQANLSRNGGR